MHSQEQSPIAYCMFYPDPLPSVCLFVDLLTFFIYS